MVSFQLEFGSEQSLGLWTTVAFGECAKMGGPVTSEKGRWPGCQFLWLCFLAGSATGRLELCWGSVSTGMEAGAWSCLGLLVLATSFPSMSPSSELCYGITLTVISIAISVTN